MPAKPLSPEQKQDAKRLKALYDAWKEKKRSAGERVTQEDASAALGIGQSAISQYLTGKIPLNVSVATKFAALLGCDINEFSPAIAEDENKLWPFNTFSPSQFYRLDETYRQKIENELLGAITRMERSLGEPPRRLVNGAPVAAQ